MIINFTKMHSLGNDFIIIDGITQNIKLHGAYIKKIADRKLGIGCDQIIILEPPIDPLSDFYYKIYNADGNSAKQCLNGVRCAARFAFDAGLIKNSTMIAECMGGKITLNVSNNQSIIANLEIINPEISSLLFQISGITLKLYNTSIGNHHLICLINDQDNIDKKLPELEDEFYESIITTINNQQNTLTQKANIGFGKIIEPNKIQLRVFERGCGETLACGTNALATFIIANHLKLIDNQHETAITFKLGSIIIRTINNHFEIIGPTNSIFTGKFKI